MPSSPLNLAHLTPLPPTRSGISDYSADLIPALASHFALTNFVDDVSAVASELARGKAEGIEISSLAPLSSYPSARWSHQLALFQVGNHPLHIEIVTYLLKYSGFLLLHDFNLHHLFEYQLLGQNHSIERYLQALYYDQTADMLVEGDRLLAGGALDYTFPLSSRVICSALGVMVHSQLSLQKIKKLQNAPPCQLVPQVMPLHRPGPVDMRTQLQLSEEVVIFGAAGQITAAKQIEQLLNAFAQLHQRYPHSHLLLIGEPIAGYPLDEMLFASGVGEHVTVTGFVDSIDRFLDWITAADVMVNCRYPTMGETSASVLRSFACGRPVIVYDHGWYSELPAEVALKIPVNDAEALLHAMFELASQSERRNEMGTAARDLIAKKHQPEAVAKEMAEFMLNTINSSYAT